MTSLNESSILKPIPMGDVIMGAVTALSPDASSEQREIARSHLTSLAVAMGFLVDPIKDKK